MFVLNNLHRLRDRPAKLQEKVFEKLFKQAEIAQLTKEEMRIYEESLKVYRDNYSIIETARKQREYEHHWKVKVTGVLHAGSEV